MTEQSYIIWHGVKGDESWPLPRLVCEDNSYNRPDQDNTTPAHEYLDQQSVLLQKIKVAAKLIKQARSCCAYTGAGLSKASGIPDYATHSSSSVASTVPKLKNSLDAQPTLAHRVLAEMEKHNFLHSWVQQNHDGLPQKAGFPQEKINEIHGAWFDPGNPVVPFSGQLRTDLYKWMLQIEKKTDLCLCLGTSLSGMNADRVPCTTADKSLLRPPKALGTIIINLQRTSLDDSAALRIWAKLDDAFTMIANELGLSTFPSPPTFLAPLDSEDVFDVPYNAKGKLDHSCIMQLDLRKGADIVIADSYAPNNAKTGWCHGRAHDGHWNIQVDHYRMLGRWWIESALRGTIPQLPIVNINPNVRSANNSKSEPVVHPQQVNETPMSPCIEVVQTHEYQESHTGNNSHLWAIYLRTTCNTIRAVVYEMHPTFRPPSIEVKEPPFRIERLGWGTFQVGVSIYLTDGSIFHGVHELSFKGQGEVKVTKIV